MTDGGPDCTHRSVLRRPADAGVPITAMYCLHCGKALKRNYMARRWDELGPVMDEARLTELQTRLGLGPAPTGMRRGQRHWEP